MLVKIGFQMIKMSVGLLSFLVSSLSNPTWAFAQTDPDYQIEVENNTVCSFINDNHVNVREKPDLNSPVISQLNRGDGVRAINRNGNWVQIAARDSRKPPTPYTPLQGYVYNQYINGCSEDQFDRWRN